MQISGTALSSCFTRRFMGRSQLAVPSILFLHQHFLHTVQPLPSSSSVYILCLTSCRLPSVFIRRPASHHCQRNYGTAGFLRSPGVTPVHRYCKPFRHLLAFLPFSVSAGYRSDLLQNNSLWGEEGFSSCWNMPLSPCCPYHPAGVSCRLGQHATCHAAFAPKQGDRPPDLSLFGGHLWVHFRYGTETRSPA